MIPEPPIEAERRKDVFRGDIPIVLSDGNTWYLPRPRLRGKSLVRRPSPDGGDVDAFMNATEFGPEYDFRLEMAIVDNLNNRLLNTELDWFARFLLRRNYRLDDRDFYYLLRFNPDDESTGDMWLQIFIAACDAVFMDVSDPKSTGDGGPNSSNGSPSPSSRTESTPTACP